MAVGKRTARRRVASSSVMVRLDAESKSQLVKAAQLRRVSLSDYIRVVTVPQARREIKSADEDTISLTPAEQLAFWTALAEPARLTKRQRQLGRLMRGDE